MYIYLHQRLLSDWQLITASCHSKKYLESSQTGYSWCTLSPRPRPACSLGPSWVYWPVWSSNWAFWARPVAPHDWVTVSCTRWSGRCSLARPRRNSSSCRPSRRSLERPLLLWWRPLHFKCFHWCWLRTASLSYFGPLLWQVSPWVLLACDWTSKLIVSQRLLAGHRLTAQSAQLSLILQCWLRLVVCCSLPAFVRWCRAISQSWRGPSGLRIAAQF